jgi:signal transduction histidine kinase
MPCRLRDVALAVGVAAFQVGATYGAGRHQHPTRGYDVFAGILLAAAGLALLFRTRWPSATLVATFVLTLGYWSIGYPRGPIFLGLVIAYVNALWTGHRRVAFAVAVAGVVGFPWLGPALGRGHGTDLGGQIAVITWLVGLTTFSELARARRTRRAETVRQRAAEAQRQADEERLRIARELHDVLAHNISLMSVQSGVALHLMDERPEQARVALEAIRHASKEALGELRHVLAVLRGDESAPRAPGGLDGLDALVARAWTAGLRVQVERTGEPRPVPAAVDLAAFRIVQEAVTNTLRHAGPGATTSVVRLGYGPDALTVQVDDDGRAPAATLPGTGDGTGSGLVGMRDRAATLGGELHAGPRAGGGFRVEARLPLPPEDAAPDDAVAGSEAAPVPEDPLGPGRAAEHARTGGER